MGIFKKKRTRAGNTETQGLPRHIAIVMDGNGRWARNRGLPRAAGHEAGAEAFRAIAMYCKDIGVEYLTVYAFSTENWKRTEEEVSAIMKLLEKYLKEAIEKIRRDGVRIRVVGDLDKLPPAIYRLANESNEQSKLAKGVLVNICLNYGGRNEILSAVEKYAREYKEGVAPALTEYNFNKYLYFDGIPDPELIIRPGGEKRISNFLLWQCAYSEFYFTDILWPSFKEKDLDDAIAAYRNRKRRFGGRP